MKRLLPALIVLLLHASAYAGQVFPPDNTEECERPGGGILAWQGEGSNVQCQNIPVSCDDGEVLTRKDGQFLCTTIAPQLKCPAGTLAMGAGGIDFCIEDNVTYTASWTESVEQCGRKGMRLCNLPEWQQACLAFKDRPEYGFLAHRNLGLGASNDTNEWVGLVDDQNGVPIGYVAGFSNSCTATNDAHAYHAYPSRCCTGPIAH